MENPVAVDRYDATPTVIGAYMLVVGYFGTVFQARSDAVCCWPPGSWPWSFSPCASGCTAGSTICCTASATSRTRCSPAWASDSCQGPVESRLFRESPNVCQSQIHVAIDSRGLMRAIASLNDFDVWTWQSEASAQQRPTPQNSVPLLLATLNPPRHLPGRRFASKRLAFRRSK